MIIYKCDCGEKLIITENTEESRGRKRGWKKEHGAPLIFKSEKRKIPDRKRAGIHGYIRNRI